jgi:hypothetical protein
VRESADSVTQNRTTMASSPRRLPDCLDRPGLE